MDLLEVYTEGLVLSTEKEVSRSVYLHDLKSHTCVVIFSTARSIVRVLKLRGVVSRCLGFTRGIMLTLQTTKYFADLQKPMCCFNYDIRKWLMTMKIRKLMPIVNLGYMHDTVRPANPVLPPSFTGGEACRVTNLAIVILRGLRSVILFAFCLMPTCENWPGPNWHHQTPAISESFICCSIFLRRNEKGKSW